MATKINGKYKSTLDAMERMDYNVDIWENIIYLRRIIQCLKGQRSFSEVRDVINQLQERIENLVDNIKTEAAPPWLRDDYKFGENDLTT